MADNENPVDESGFDFSDIEAPLPEAPQVKAQTPEEAAGLLSDTDLSALGADLEAQAKYGDSPATASALAAASTATFSLSDRALKKMGIMSEEDLESYRRYNEEADLAGTIVGAVAPALIPVPGTGPAAVGARAAATAAGPAMAALKAGAMAEKAVASAIAKSGSKVLAKDIVKKSLELGARGATEGAAFGTGALLREEALGQADLNAENLIAHAGTGALFGGLVGGALPVAGAAVKQTGSKAGHLFEKVATKYSDPRKAAEELTGFNLTKLMKLESNPAGKELLADLPRWYSEEVGLSLADKAEDILTKVEGVRQRAADSIDEVLNEADAAAATRLAGAGDSPELRKRLLTEVADNIENDFIKPYSEFASMRPQVRKVEKLRDDILTQANKSEALTGRSLIDLKRKLDTIAANFYDRAPGAKAKNAELAAFRARSLVKKASEAYVKFIDPALAERLISANKSYHYAAEILPSLARKAAKDKDFLGFKDMLFGVLGYGVGDVAGLSVLAGKKFLDSDLRRKMAIMTGIRGASENVTKRSKTALNNFFKSTSRPGRLTATQVLLQSSLAQDRTDGNKSTAPKSKKEAYANISKNLINFSAQPAALLERTVRAGAPISGVAPQTAQHVGEKLVGAVQFLQSKVPKRPYEVDMPGMKPKPYEPSSMEISKFERYLQAVEAPMSVLEDLESNALTREHVEAIKAVYPKLYQHIQELAFDKMRDTEEVLPYAKKVQLSLLLDLDGDASLLGKNIAALQANFKVQEMPEGGAVAAGQGMVPPTAGGAQQVDASNRTASDTTAFLKRRQE